METDDLKSQGCNWEEPGKRVPEGGNSTCKGQAAGLSSRNSRDVEEARPARWGQATDQEMR